MRHGGVERKLARYVSQYCATQCAVCRARIFETDHIGLFRIYFTPLWVNVHYAWPRIAIGYYTDLLSFLAARFFTIFVSVV